MRVAGAQAMLKPVGGAGSGDTEPLMLLPQRSLLFHHASGMEFSWQKSGANTPTLAYFLPPRYLHTAAIERFLKPASPILLPVLEFSLMLREEALSGCRGEVGSEVGLQRVNADNKTEHTDHKRILKTASPNCL